MMMLAGTKRRRKRGTGTRRIGEIRNPVGGCLLSKIHPKAEDHHLFILAPLRPRTKSKTKKPSWYIKGGGPSGDPGDDSGSDD
eukprot:8103792-Karenia_brevis.AAC.1